MPTGRKKVIKELLEKNFNTFRDDFFAIPEELRYLPMRDVGILGVDRSRWMRCNIKAKSGWNSKGQAYCKKTMEILSQIPGLLRVTYLTMTPPVFLHPHVGDTPGVIRHHLCLEMAPEDRDWMGLVVGDQVHRWQEGLAFSFNDDHIHMAWHYGKKPRTSLVVDVMEGDS